MRAVFWPLAGMLLLQTLSTMMFLTVPVLAPVLAAELGIAASTIGIYSALVFAAAMFVSMAVGTLILRYGAIRTAQAGILLSSAALLFTTIGTLPVILLGAVLCGAGYGPNTPAGSHVLARITPPRMRGLVFSIKQSGAPLGGALAGLVVPLVAVAAGWRAAVLVSAALGVLAALLIQPLRARLDDDRRPGLPVSVATSFASLRMLVRHEGLRPLTIASFVYAAMQMSMFSFLVAYLVEDLGLTLVLAGMIYSVMQISGVVARVVWGWVADHLLPARLLLALLGIGSALFVAATAGFTARWPLAAVTAVAALVGATVSGWNGVFLAEVARVVPQDQVGAATGGTLFFTYFGLVVGPTLFSIATAATGGYEAGFCLMGALALAAGLLLLSGRQPRSGGKA